MKTKIMTIATTMSLIRRCRALGGLTFFQPSFSNVALENSAGTSSPRIRNLLRRNVSTTQPLSEKAEVKVTFVRANGERIETKGKEGDSLLDVVVNNEIDLDGFGACEGTLTCSTCHLILPKDVYDALPDKPTDEEMDMLDLAYELSETSRLGCQVILTKNLDGLEVKVPSTVNDARA
ncbi:adrenodoxin [Cephus cinctus]|uniref:Adrenodoxin n=1 Tax=Cephus cinctus TaxID=211228 RepID=A0AAJ7BWS2_CEPCN|nr:adrenodoxin [Cephus cinctus]XP_015596330.1 adrenodoxin [Cephus cinctus]XP_015596331.1 adrenodoxin [Cephus cinctus]